MRASYVSIRGSCALSLHVDGWGKSGPPCMLLHGFAESANVWNEFAPRLGGRFRTLAMDLRGHGDSDWHPQSSYQVESFVDDLDQVLRVFGGEPVTLVGHSLGAEIAMLFSAAAPQRVRRLVIVDFGPEIGAAAADQLRAEYRSMPRHFKSITEYEQWLADRRPLVQRNVLARFAASNLRQVPGGFEIKSDPALAVRPQFGQLNGRGRRDDAKLWKALSSIKCPCLVVRGQGSAILPSDVARRMVTEALVDGHLTVVNRVGHGVVMENASGLFEATRSFLFGSDARDGSPIGDGA